MFTVPCSQFSYEMFFLYATNSRITFPLILQDFPEMAHIAICSTDVLGQEKADLQSAQLKAGKLVGLFSFDNDAKKFQDK